jgi:hypothetical protein
VERVRLRVVRPAAGALPTGDANVRHLHGLWLYACGHEAFRCRCIEHGGEPAYRNDLCALCRLRLRGTDLPPLALPPIDAHGRAEPFPLATD